KCNIKAVYNYGGSGRLLNRILAGHIPDIFIPGSMKWANILKEKGYIKDYKSIAYHIPVIITPTGNFKIKSLKDFYKKNNRIVLGSDGVCAIGKVSSAILKKAGLKKINIIAGGITVKHLVMWVSRNNADASIVWMADALQCNKECNKIRIIEIPKKYNCISIIPVCLMIKHKKKASVYIRHLLNQESRNIFRKHGFKVVR
ncbi:MAG: substrate-binding domain-containing protein, partial [Candidatus Omnitrophica bacterium]|nr:substrate-binding domain-containing protein [Candidatus Omnitrophota bacterium]